MGQVIEYTENTNKQKRNKSIDDAMNLSQIHSKQIWSKANSHHIASPLHYINDCNHGFP